MTRHQRLALQITTVLADLQRTTEMVRQKFPKLPQQTLDDITNTVPEQMVEWVATSLNSGSGRWPEDKLRFTGRDKLKNPQYS